MIVRNDVSRMLRAITTNFDVSQQKLMIVASFIVFLQQSAVDALLEAAVCILVQTNTPWSFCRDWAQLGFVFVEYFLHELSR